MYRYVGFLWDTADPRSTHRAQLLSQQLVEWHPDWNACCRAPGMQLFAPQAAEASAKRYILPNGRGAILGCIFPAKSEQWNEGWQPDLSEVQAIRITSTGGTALTRDFWGAYIAFLHDPDSHINCVIRDCSGRFPCYLTTDRDVSIFFGDINDLENLDLPPFQIDTRYLAAFIYSPELQVNHSALGGVTELLSGQRLQQAHGVNCISSLWDPCETARSRFIESAAVARAALRATTEYCVAAWASTYSTIVHSLSGGLDSAIVLGCLSRARVRPYVVCVNRFHSVPGEDERLYARRAAELAGCEFVEHPWCDTNRVFDASLLAFPRTPKPYIPMPFSLLDADSWNSVTKRYGAQAVWTGEGGDHIFFNVPTSLGAADYIQTHRALFFLGLISAIRDAARYSREPYIGVWRNSVKLGRSRAPWKSQVEAARTNSRPVSFLHYDSLPKDVDRYVTHPWMLHLDDLPKGKQLQVELLLELLNRHRFSPALLYAPEHHPLISQPLLELSLQIPLYLLTIGGRQRGLAREAFQDIVPLEILAREDKGSTSVLWIRKVRESHAFLRDLLLDGWLANRGLIDRTSLEPYLVGRQPIRPEQWSPLAASIAAEMWVRSWLSERATTAQRSPRATASPVP